MLEVGGFTPLSTTDWPDQLVAVVFVQGCPWRCHYCHNAGLQSRARDTPSAWSRALATLRQRQGLLDGVVFSGGEPTLDPALPQAMQAVRDLGFRVGLHTAGIYPDRLRAVLPLVDWVGFDVKTGFADYERVTAVPRSGAPVRQSLDWLLNAARARQLDFEIRTTWHPALQDDQTLFDLAEQLSALGITDWQWQPCRPTPGSPPELATRWHPPSASLLEGVAQRGLRVVLR